MIAQHRPSTETNRAAWLQADQITAGDLVPPHQDHLVDLRIEGEAEALRPSTSHPFWVEHGDQPAAWLQAGKIRVGDRVETAGGQWRRVTAIAPEEKPATVYNFTVDQDHDYFVGQTGFLVHNAPNCTCRIDEQTHHIVAENSMKARQARQILGKAGIDVNDPRNLIPLLTDFHQLLHTNAYYDAVNSLLQNAWNNGGAQGVENALEHIREQVGCGTWVPK